MDRNLVLVRGARQLITLRGPSGPRSGPALQDLAIIPDGSLLIRDGVIEDVGPTRRIENLAAARNAFVINAAGRVVMPGFVDSGTQIVFAHARRHGQSMGERQALIEDGAHAIQSVSGKWLLNRSAAIVRGMVRHGTSSIEARSGYGLDSASLFKILRVHAALKGKPLDMVSNFFGASAVPSGFEDHPEEYLDMLRTEMLPRIKGRGLARFVGIRIGKGAFTGAAARCYLQAAAALGFAVKIEAGRGAGSEAIALAVETRARAITNISSCTPEDAAMLAESRIMATLEPGRGFQSGTGAYSPARALIDSGCPVALASGFNPDENRGYNMQTAVFLACRYLNLTPAEAISAATINGAHAIGAGDRTGSLESGKNADLILLNVADYRDIPDNAGVNNVCMSLKKGEIIYREGEVICGAEDRGVRAELLGRA